MSKPIIEVEGLSKKYRLGVVGATTLRDDLGRAWNRLRGAAPATDKGEFWALRDVSFSVQPGEVVGIIGRNGAGKSTLLKILSRITEPTSGRAILRGRVASLLEVGTGFHPDLTGRENVYLNGSILGMKRAEIAARFDEIVAFAEVEKFIDTPVKHYSSGMSVRLAFAVAAHLDAEILILDEVLAVGDAAFQQKCLGKMNDIANSQGRTALFVSHNIRSIQSLCSRAVLLQQGSVACGGAIADVLAGYFSASAATRHYAEFPADPSRPSITGVRIDPAELTSGNLVFEVSFRSPFALSPPIVGITVTSSQDTPVYGSNPRIHPDGYGTPRLSHGKLRLRVDSVPIPGGTYKASAWLGDWQGDFDYKRDAVTFEFLGTSSPAHVPSPEIIGFVNTRGHWTVEDGGR